MWSNPPQGHHPFLGFRVFIWDRGVHTDAATPTATQDSKGRALELQLDPTSYFTENPKGEEGEEWSPVLS